MRSGRPKPLHRLCGRPMVLHVIDALGELDVDRAVVVVGFGAERVMKALSEQALGRPDLYFVEQAVQRGTGDAVSVALAGMPDVFGDDIDESDVLVLPGDTPLLRPATLAALVRAHRVADAAATVLTARLDDPRGYGRVVRDAREGSAMGVCRIVEEGDATDEERAIDEINTSIYCFRRSVLAPALRRLSPENAQGEYYLTDTVAVLHDAGYSVGAVTLSDPTEAAGVNDRAQLAAAEAELRDRTNERWMRRGVTMLDPERTIIDADVELGRDVTLFPGVMLQGSTRIAEGAEIGPNSHIIDSAVGEHAWVSYSVCRSADIGAGARVGPFASLEPGARVAPGAVTGPFWQGTDGDADPVPQT